MIYCLFVISRRWDDFFLSHSIDALHETIYHFNNQTSLSDSIHIIYDSNTKGRIHIYYVHKWSVHTHRNLQPQLQMSIS